MKIKAFLKRTLCLTMILATLLVGSACTANEGMGESDSAYGSDIVSAVGDKIVLSDISAVRIVYSSAYKSLAQSVSNKLAKLDPTYVKGSGKYAIEQDTKVDEDGVFEILIGSTNRAASVEARNMVNGKKNSYSIYVTNNSIAVYSSAKAGVEEGVEALLKKISKADNTLIYDNSAGNITGKYTVAIEQVEKKQHLPSALTTTPAKTDIDGDALLATLKNAAGSKAYSVAVSTTDGIKVASIRNTNAQNTYSVSKVYCVTAIGMLYDEGKIKMTDTIGNIFKDEIKAYGIDENKWANITIHDVLKHNIGYTQGSLLDIDVHDKEWKSWDKDFLKLTLSYKIDGNKSYMYSDAAYYLISRVVTKISGEKLDVFLKSRLFDKAGYKDYKTTYCPQGYPMGATQFYFRPDDVVKLGRIYLDGGTYNGQRIISQEWVNLVIAKGYELKSSNNGYGKGGMRGQYIYVNFKHNVAVAWLSETDSGTDGLGSKLSSFMK